MKPKKGKCSVCGKEKDIMTYADSIMDYVHGFKKEVCEECADKLMKDSPLYQRGRRDGISEERQRLLRMIEHEKDNGNLDEKGFSFALCLSHLTDELREELEEKD